MASHELLEGALDSVLLLGILLTAVVSIFKAGRWFGGMVSAMESLSQALEAFKASFERHTTDEEARFVSVETTIAKHGERISDLRGDIHNLSQAINGGRSGAPL